jgi:hypothetical protein
MTSSAPPGKQKSHREQLFFQPGRPGPGGSGNSKFECRNSKQIPISEIPRFKTGPAGGRPKPNWGWKFEIRSTKSETNLNASNPKVQNGGGPILFRISDLPAFDIVSEFGFRASRLPQVSDFGFRASGLPASGRVSASIGVILRLRSGRRLRMKKAMGLTRSHRATKGRDDFRSALLRVLGASV